ncbi:MAG: Lar family restriction alleviation protein [Deltaproteobacteria bacterium]|jgi:Lar family restriction alleviation protein|nr:Lar family restriction alleviation protein [Deltaproteobacteria bacterium]
MDETLKPCPFCGGEAEVVRETYRPVERRLLNRWELVTRALPLVCDGWLMECRGCGARGPHEYTEPVQSIQEAKTAWNRRRLDTTHRASSTSTWSAGDLEP